MKAFIISHGGKILTQKTIQILLSIQVSSAKGSTTNITMLFPGNK